MVGLFIFIGVVVLLSAIVFGSMANRRKWVRFTADRNEYTSISDHYSYLKDKGVRCKLEQERQEAAPGVANTGTLAATSEGSVDHAFSDPPEVLKVHRDDIEKAHHLIEQYSAYDSRSFRL